MPATYTYDATSITEGDWRDGDFGTLDQGLNGAVGLVTGISPTQGAGTNACRVSLSNPVLSANVKAIRITVYSDSSGSTPTITVKVLSGADATLATASYVSAVGQAQYVLNFTDLDLDQTASDAIRIEFDSTDNNVTLAQSTVTGYYASELSGASHATLLAMGVL